MYHLIFSLVYILNFFSQECSINPEADHRYIEGFFYAVRTM